MSAVTVSGAAIEKKQSCAATCGSVCYTQGEIDDAVSQGYGYHEDGQTVGTSAGAACLPVPPLLPNTQDKRAQLSVCFWRNNTKQNTERKKTPQKTLKNANC